MEWLYYRLFARIDETSIEPRDRFTAAGRAGFAAIERAVAAFYREHRPRIHGMLLFHYRETVGEDVLAEGRLDLRAGQDVEYLRLRLRIARDDGSWARQQFRRQVVDPLLASSPPRLFGWELNEGYEARNDVGARFGDLARGVDPTEAVVTLLTGATELRFVLLEHPDFRPNHDLVHLYCNTLGLAYPEEIEALEARVAKVRGFLDQDAAAASRTGTSARGGLRRP